MRVYLLNQCYTLFSKLHSIILHLYSGIVHRLPFTFQFGISSHYAGVSNVQQELTPSHLENPVHNVPITPPPTPMAHLQRICVSVHLDTFSMVWWFLSLRCFFGSSTITCHIVSQHSDDYYPKGLRIMPLIHNLTFPPSPQMTAAPSVLPGPFVQEPWQNLRLHPGTTQSTTPMLRVPVRLQDVWETTNALTVTQVRC